MGNLPALANTAYNIHDRMHYDPLRGVVTARKVQSPHGIGTRVTFSSHSPRQQMFNTKASMFYTPEYQAAYQSRRTLAYDAMPYHYMNSAFNVDTFNNTRMKTLHGTTLHTGTTGIVHQSLYSHIASKQ